MSRGTEVAHLRERQYGTATNFNARVALHARFRTNPISLTHVVFDHLLRLPADAQVLELGCGPGWLWRANAARIPDRWRVTLTDFSPGMVREARQSLGTRPGFRFVVADAQSLPFAPETFDAVIANHMLYHVPDRARAYSEMQRALRPGGRVFATTIGAGHMREFSALVSPFGVNPSAPLFPQRFLLENGGTELARWFADVRLDRHEDILVVPEAAPIVAYACSMTRYLGSSAAERDERIARLTEHVEGAIAANGPLHFSSESGLFTATRR